MPKILVRVLANTVVGAIMLATRRARQPIDSSERDLLVSVGIQLGGAVYRATLYKRLDQRRQDLENRLNELTALNNLFQQHLKERDQRESEELEFRSALGRVADDLQEVLKTLRAQIQHVPDSPPPLEDLEEIIRGLRTQLQREPGPHPPIG